MVKIYRILQLMNPPPLLKVRYLAAFSQTLDGMGIPIAGLFARAKINQRVLADHNAWMPVEQLCDFVRAGALASGRCDIGLEASLIPRKQHSDFSKKYLVAPTLYRSLRAICDHSSMEDTSANFRLIRRGDMTWLDCGAVRGPHESIRQIELYRLGALANIIRQSAGEEWAPSCLRLQSTDDGRLADVPLVRDTNVRFGAPSMAIGFPTRLLNRPPQQAKPVLNRPLGEVGRKPMHGNLPAIEAAAKEAVRSQLKAGVNGIKQVANSLEISTRTLQRILQQHDLTYSTLLEQMKMETARELLAETDMSHDEISREIGYQHSTHFARAFRRICGMSPRQYRSIESTGLG